MQNQSNIKKSWQEEYLEYCQANGLIAKEFKNLLRFQSAMKKEGAKWPALILEIADLFFL